MSDPLLLSGAIPGWLRRGAPVVLTTGEWFGDYYEALGGDCGIVHRVDPESFEIASWNETHGSALLDHDATRVALDLRDPAGRDIAARWVAERLYPADGPYIAAAVLPGVVLGPMRFGLQTVSVEEGARFRIPPAFDCTDDLNPLGLGLLPDGSRLVDALALAAVVRHLAGVDRG